jgi:hypothetical protein
MKNSIIEKSSGRILSILSEVPEVYLVVDVSSPQLFHIVNESVQNVFPVSTARNGTGNREGSNKTPTGIHRIIEKIGDGAQEGTIFRSRQAIGEIWYPGLTEENLILTRILRLRGIEEGINSGPGVDSYDRYIYIHGTNQEIQIGTPISHGCICMKNRDIITLFDMIGEDTLVVID